MVAGCGNNMLKYILLFLNFLIFVLALAGLITSLVFILKPGTLDEAGKVIGEFGELKDTLSPGTIKLGLYVILAASVIILVISFLGCCGAWKEIKFLLGLYATILLIILVIEIAAFVLAIVYKGKVKEELKKALVDAKTKNATMYGDLEKTLKCCGVETGDACQNTQAPPKTGTAAPMLGCYNKILELLETYFMAALIISIVTIVIELFLITFSCCLCSNIGESKIA